MVELERKVKCGSCKETFIQKWVVAQKKWSQINEVNYWTDGKGWNDYELLCRSCLKKWFEEYREDFLNLVDISKRKMFVNYKTDGVFDKPDHVNQLNKLELSKKKNGENNVEKKLTAAHRGTLDLAGFKLPCFNLEDGRALLASNSVQVALKMVGEDEQKVRGRNLKEFLSQKSLEPFVEKEKGIRHFDPIVFYDKGVKINGYEAEVLPDICNIYLEARNNIQLAPRQKVIADQCEILIRAFAKVGINALVAEATGYQRVRDDFELQKNLAAYVSEETLEWQKTFHDDFYEQLYRLWKKVPTPGIKPWFFGTLTNELIYKKLPKGVLEALKEKTPKNKKLHQSLTPEIGKEHLKKQINSVAALGKISEDKDEFLKLVEKYDASKKKSTE